MTGRLFFAAAFLPLFLGGGFSSANAASSVSGGETSSGKGVEISGKLRFRAFYFQTSSDWNGVLEGEGNKEVSYQDMFFRSLVEIPVEKNFKIRTQMDVYSALGENDGSLGQSDLGLQVRQLYLMFQGDYLGLSAGYFGHSVQGGYVLAQNGAGLQLNFTLFHGAIKPYLDFIKAYDNSRYSWPEGRGQSNYKDSNIFILGTGMNPISFLKMNVYGIYFNDRDTVSGTEPSGELTWYGGEALVTGSLVTFSTHWIGNRGAIEEAGETRDINAYLGSVQIGLARSFENSSAGISFFSEGASGRLSDPLGGDSFQTIVPSHDITNIAVDNSGGLSMSGGNLAGLLLAGVKVSFDFFGVQTRTGYARVAPFNAAAEVRYGDELFMDLSAKPSRNTKLFLKGGLFWPHPDQAGFLGVTGSEAIREIFAGMETYF